MDIKVSYLRRIMGMRGIDAYIIPTSDFHASEYVGDYFKARKYITGFTGSAGVALVTQSEAILWTDGRYFIQAEKELEDSEFELYRMGEEDVPTLYQYLERELPEYGVLAFDGRVISTAAAKKYEKLVKEKHGELYIQDDLVDMIWEDRPELPSERVWILTEEYSGMSVEAKLDLIRIQMKKNGAKAHLISSLYDIAWILNLRGDDIDHVPVFLSYLYIEENMAALYIQAPALSKQTRNFLNHHHIDIRDYDQVYADMEELDGVDSIMMDLKQVNYMIGAAIPDDIEIIDAPNPSEALKAVKNETELANTRVAHRKDGVAVTKFMYWLKTNVGKMPITEYTAGEKLNALRMKQADFLDLSFDNICAYGPNAAMMHYSAKEDDCAELKPEGMLLVDSGGHYMDGSTDITRTFVLGPISDEEKLHFTLVCKANLALANAKFLYGCCGTNLDILARGPLWNLGLDYKCGTGHGVGHLLNVHEGPNGFRWKIVPERMDSGKLEAGMITTDEPGVYLEGKYGIRTENELICIEQEKNEYGQFMAFENITYCPIDLDGIDPEELSRTEKKWLNDYHAKVYETLSPYMTEEENAWLKEYTRAI